jgi:hypothetical protein
MSNQRISMIRALATATMLAAVTLLVTVATVLADSGGGPFPR